MTRKSTGISVYHNLKRLVFARCFLSSALAAGRTFHRRGFSGLFAAAQILTVTGLCGTKYLLL